MNSFQGHFLVAAPYQHDPNFARTVILVVEHTDRGAFGLIMNGPSEECSRNMRGVTSRRFLETFKLFLGGPVTGPLMAVHARAALGERQLLPGIFFSAKEKNVLRLAWQAKQPCRIFTGYAGWGPEQLEYEVEEGIWRVVPATPMHIFFENRHLWEHLSRQASRLQLCSMFNLKHIPANPLLN